jgi:hypothetical protein
LYTKPYKQTIFLQKLKKIEFLFYNYKNNHQILIMAEQMVTLYIQCALENAGKHLEEWDNSPLDVLTAADVKMFLQGNGVRFSEGNDVKLITPHIQISPSHIEIESSGGIFPESTEGPPQKKQKQDTQPMCMPISASRLVQRRWKTSSTTHRT